MPVSQETSDKLMALQVRRREAEQALRRALDEHESACIDFVTTSERSMNRPIGERKKERQMSECPTCMQPIRPTAAHVRRLRLGGWSGMKHHLVRIGVIASTDQDAPIEWQRAFVRAFGRTLTNEVRT